MNFPRAFAILAFASSLAASLPAHAQDNGNGPAAEPPKPTDVQTIGDWMIRCFPNRKVAPCEVYQQLASQKTQQLVLAISVAYVPTADRHGLTIVVPLGVALAKGAMLQTSSFTSSPLHYRRCDRSGCYVEQLVDNNSIESLAKADPDATVNVVADDGRSVKLKFSLKGFSAAHDAMVALSRQKTAGAPETKK